MFGKLSDIKSLYFEDRQDPLGIVRDNNDIIRLQNYTFTKPLTACVESKEAEGTHATASSKL